MIALVIVVVGAVCITAIICRTVANVSKSFWED